MNISKIKCKLYYNYIIKMNISKFNIKFIILSEKC